MQLQAKPRGDMKTNIRMTVPRNTSHDRKALAGSA